MIQFGPRLRALRKAHGYGQRELAEKINVAQTTIANYEANSRFPGPDTLVQLADVFLVSIDFLVGREPWEHRYPCSTWNRREEADLECTPEQLQYFLDRAEVPQAVGLLQHCLSSSDDLEYVYQVLVAPAMEAVFANWQDGAISDFAAMRFFERMRSVIAHIPTLFPSSRRVSGRDGLAILARGNEHDIGLRMIKENLELAGWNIFFLGEQYSYGQIQDFVREGRPRLVCISAALDSQIAAARELIVKIKESAAVPPVILVGGSAFDREPGRWKHVGADGWTANGTDVARIADKILLTRQEEKG